MPPLIAGSALGQGVLDLNGVTIKKIPIFIPNTCLNEADKLINTLYNEPLLSLHDFANTRVRQEQDNIIFDELGLSVGERDAVYEAVIDLVESRLQKAGSLKRGD